jgi:hypothetical protein
VRLKKGVELRRVHLAFFRELRISSNAIFKVIFTFSVSGEVNILNTYFQTRHIVGDFLGPKILSILRLNLFKIWDTNQSLGILFKGLLLILMRQSDLMNLNHVWFEIKSSLRTRYNNNFFFLKRFSFVSQLNQFSLDKRTWYFGL